MQDRNRKTLRIKKGDGYGLERVSMIASIDSKDDDIKIEFGKQNSNRLNDSIN